MKIILATVATLALTAGIAPAQQAVLGTGAFSQSESSQGFVGTSVSGAGSIGPGLALSSNVQTMAGSQASFGASRATTNTLAASGATSATGTTSNVGIGSTSFSASTGQAGGIAFGGNQNQAFSGSAANAFGGFGISLN